MRGHFLWLALVSVALISVLAGTASAQTLGLTIKIKASEDKDAPVTEEVQLYKSSHALVIGIDNYTGGWPRLSNAVKDARLVAAELKKRGFNVTLKIDLKSAELKLAFEEFFVVTGADPQARLFVWYAGHGHTADDEGFLVPADAPKPSTGPRFKLKALNMRRFGEYVRQAESKHAFAVFDSCFAGTVFDSQRALPPEAITLATTMPVRQFLTSGDATQTVSDDGTFRELFLRALRGEERADANGDGYLTGSEMGLFLTDRMTNLTRARQTPRYGKLRDKDYDLGDFVFALAAPPPRTSSPASPTAPTGMTAEMMFWQSMKDSTNPADFEDYIDQFPNGTFTRLAKRRVTKMREQRVASLNPAKPSYEIEDIDATYVVVKTANIRSEPSAQSEKVGMLGADTGVTVTGKIKGEKWYRIAHAGKTAYVFAPLIMHSDAAEIEAWGKIKTSKKADDFEGFLRRYSAGYFQSERRVLRRL